MRMLLLLLLSWAAPCAAQHVATTDKADPVILAVFAHPDDEISVAPLLARYAREGARVHLAIVTDGRFGVTGHAGIPAGDELAGVRAREARCATGKLGIEPPHLLGFQDGFTHKTDDQGRLLELLDSLHARLRSLFDELRPEVVITWGPEGGYGHSDHRLVSNVVTELFQSGTGKWPSKLYFPGFSTSRLSAWENPAAGPVAQWFAANWHPVDGAFLDIRIPYSEADLQSASAAQVCHASQYTREDAGQLVELVDDLYDGAVTLRSWHRDGNTGDR